jgi:hypothetical protein
MYQSLRMPQAVKHELAQRRLESTVGNARFERHRGDVKDRRSGGLGSRTGSGRHCDMVSRYSDHEREKLTCRQ